MNFKNPIKQWKQDQPKKNLLKNSQKIKIQHLHLLNNSSYIIEDEYKEYEFIFQSGRMILIKKKI